jgi:hypothetical protein
MSSSSSSGKEVSAFIHERAALIACIHTLGAKAGTPALMAHPKIKA